MAISPADFYAYSRATGAPIPEDEQERAQMAPEVLEFRRNQLKAPEGELVVAGLRGFGPYKNVNPAELEQRRQELMGESPKQESNPLAALGTAALGLGALAGLGFGARALMGRGRQIPKGPAKSATAGVRQVNLADMEQAVRRVAAEPAPSQAPPTRQEVYKAVAEKPESELPRVYRPKSDIYDRISYAADPDALQAETLITDPNTGEIFARGKSPQSFAETYVSLRPALTGQRTDLSTARTPGTFKEFSQGITGASPDIVDALIQKYEEDYRRAEPFQYGSELSRQAAIARKNEQLIDDVLAEVRGGQPNLTDLQQSQRLINADQFINAVESGEDQTTGRLIQKLNIADPWGQSTIPPSMVNEQQPTLLLPAAAVSPREKAQSFLQSRFEELGAVIPGRYRRERAMGTDPTIAEAMELYASTGDPAVLSRLSQTPSSPLTVQPRVQMELLEETIPTGKFYKPTGQGEFIDHLFEKDIDLTNRISALGVQKQAIINRLEEIDQLEPQFRFAAADEPGQGGYYTRLLNKMMYEKQSLNPDSVNVDLGDALAERDYVRGQMESLEALGTQYKPLKREEGVRPFFEVDPVTGEPIAETLEVRGGRPSIETEAKGGGGRNVAEFVAGAGNVTAEAVREILQGGRRTRVRDFDIETGGLPQVFEEDRSQTGRSVGIYGIEPRNKPIADPELKPTALQREETKMNLRRGDYPKFKTSITSTPEQKRQSLEVSEALRRATIEGRDPQSVLRQFGIGI